MIDRIIAAKLILSVLTQVVRKSILLIDFNRFPPIIHYQIYVEAVNILPPCRLLQAKLHR